MAREKGREREKERFEKDKERLEKEQQKEKERIEREKEKLEQKEMKLERHVNFPLSFDLFFHLYLSEQDLRLTCLDL